MNFMEFWEGTTNTRLDCRDDGNLDLDLDLLCPRTSPCRPGICPVPCRLLAAWPGLTTLAASQHGSHDGRRPAHCPFGQAIPMRLCRRELVYWRARPLPCKSGIVRRAGKSIIQMLLRGHQMTAVGRSSALNYYYYYYFIVIVIFIIEQENKEWRMVKD